MLTYWILRHYNISGTERSSDTYGDFPDYNNIITQATNRKLSLALNGIDQLNFTLFLDDPVADNMRRLHSVVTLQRQVYTDVGELLYEDDAIDNLSFTGIVTNTVKNGAENTMDVTVMSPLWRLQSRFHLLNHYLQTNPDTAQFYTESELMWKLIDLVNNAFGSESNTGIALGTFTSTSEITVAPMFIAKGSNTWTNIYDGIMGRAGSVDLVPEYVHYTDDPTLMLFSTAEKRGVDRLETFNFHTGTDDNLDNLTEEETPLPGEFANYLWTVGKGGPNGGKIAVAENDDEDDDGHSTIGVYMKRADYPDEIKIGLVGPPATFLNLDAQSELAQARVPKSFYTMDITPGFGSIFGNEADYYLGDVIRLNANKGALYVNNKQQRIYNADITLSDNRIETISATIANDFTGRVIDG